MNNIVMLWSWLGLPWWFSGKESACQCKRYGFNPWVGKNPWRRKWYLTPVFLSGKSHGQKEPGGLQSVGSQRVRYDLVTVATTVTGVFGALIMCEHWSECVALNSMRPLLSSLLLFPLDRQTLATLRVNAMRSRSNEGSSEVCLHSG